MTSTVIQKVAGIIIKDKKILLVSNDKQKFYWTPGGKIEPEETPEQALKREIEEELSITITEFSYYFTYMSEHEEDNINRQVYTYLVPYDQKIRLASEITKSIWFDKSQFVDNASVLQSGVRNHLIPQLITDNLL